LPPLGFYADLSIFGLLSLFFYKFDLLYPASLSRWVGEVPFPVSVSSFALVLFFSFVGSCAPEYPLPRPFQRIYFASVTRPRPSADALLLKRNSLFNPSPPFFFFCEPEILFSHRSSSRYVSSFFVSLYFQIPLFLPVFLARFIRFPRLFANILISFRRNIIQIHSPDRPVPLAWPTIRYPRGEPIGMSPRCPAGQSLSLTSSFVLVPFPLRFRLPFVSFLVFFFFSGPWTGARGRVRVCLSLVSPHFTGIMRHCAHVPSWL